MIATYRLLVPHRHNRVWRDVGDELELPEQTGDDLVAQGTAERVGEPAGTVATTPPPVARAAAPRRAAVFTPRAGRSCSSCGWSK